MAKSAKINARRHRFALEESVEQSDGAGGVSRQYKCVAHVWGTLEALSVSSNASREIAERRELAMRYRIVMSWRSDIDGTKRLRLCDRLFSVIAARDPDGRMRELVVVVEGVTP